VNAHLKALYRSNTPLTDPGQFEFLPICCPAFVNSAFIVANYVYSMGKTKNAKERFWEDYGYVLRGKQRRQVITMMEKPMSVTQLKVKAGLSLSETSRVLRGFAKQRLAACITPEHLTGRIYALTAKGKRIRDELAKTST
jgi:hypothetical protein